MSPAQSGVMPDALVTRLESENAFLRSELEARTDDIRRRDHIVAGLVERVKALPAGDNLTGCPPGHNAGTATRRAAG